jgi:hypothetical protein
MEAARILNGGGEGGDEAGADRRMLRGGARDRYDQPSRPFRRADVAMGANRAREPALIEFVDGIGPGLVADRIIARVQCGAAGQRQTGLGRSAVAAERVEPGVEQVRRIGGAARAAELVRCNPTAAPGNRVDQVVPQMMIGPSTSGLLFAVVFPATMVFPSAIDPEPIDSPPPSTPTLLFAIVLFSRVSDPLRSSIAPPYPEPRPPDCHRRWRSQSWRVGAGWDRCRYAVRSPRHRAH